MCAPDKLETLRQLEATFALEPQNVAQFGGPSRAQSEDAKLLLQQASLLQRLKLLFRLVPARVDMAPKQDVLQCGDQFTVVRDKLISFNVVAVPLRTNMVTVFFKNRFERNLLSAVKQAQHDPISANQLQPCVPVRTEPFRSAGNLRSERRISLSEICEHSANASSKQNHQFVAILSGQALNRHFNVLFLELQLLYEQIDVDYLREALNLHVELDLLERGAASQFEIVQTIQDSDLLVVEEAQREAASHFLSYNPNISVAFVSENRVVLNAHRETVLYDAPLHNSTLLAIINQLLSDAHG